IQVLGKASRSGSQEGSQRRQFGGDFEPRPATINTANSHIERLQATPATPARCLLSSGSRVRILPGALIFTPRNPWRQTVARAGCHSTLHTVFTSSASRPQVMLATLGLSPTPASRAAIAPGPAVGRDGTGTCHALASRPGISTTTDKLGGNHDRDGTSNHAD